MSEHITSATAATTPGARSCECPEEFKQAGRHLIRQSCVHEAEAERLQQEREERERIERDRQQKIHRCLQDYHRLGGPPRRYDGLTLDSIDDRPGSLAGKEAVLKYIATWEERHARGEGLIFAGSIGTGKTMLAVAIANTLAAQGHQARFLTVSGMQAAARDWDEANERMRDLKRADLVVLDDFGQERATEWASGVLFDLIDGRCRDKRPTLFTTNLSARQLREHYVRCLTRGNDQMPADQAAITVDRLLSRVRELNASVTFEGPDQRAGTSHAWLMP